MAPPSEVIDLVERFQRNADAYRSVHYNETQLRREFLDPFFEALGWDIYNRHGHAEAYKDVIHEDAIKVGGETKAPDYCFRIGGTRKFFVEAKKPAVNIKDDPSPAFQLRRYAWSSKLPLSLLSDFEETAVYDCRIAPLVTDKASAARVLYYTCAQYLDHWDELAATFSKEAVLRGSFDKFVESTRVKKGTAEVDSAFLSEIENWRKDLAGNLALRNPALTQRELNFAVQRTIDRIIFLRICEDRGIERYGQLRDLMTGEGIYGRLCTIFERADERYNSGLFHFQKEKDRAEPPDDLTLKLHVDDARLKAIFKRLYYPDSPYEFSVLPADILGQVYEQFLGKVIVLTAGHHAKVEDKPEVKKAHGVYYTPTYVVDYIVKNTVGKLLDGKTPKQAAKLRILDPACGSGSFLIGAYQHLLNWHRDWYVADGAAKHTKEIYPGAGGEWRLTIGEKKRILRHNVYGVDIDAQAVETTKLSLLLKVLEGESEQTLNTTYRLFHERALPDLGDNIKCGNSLIGPDFYDQQRMTFLDEEERYRINAFDWGKEFAEIMHTGGFDAVIGNPPYGAALDEEQKGYYSAHFSTQTYQLDSYLLFLEQAIKILIRPGAFYGMIIPNPWLTNLLQTKVRKFITSFTKIRSIVHFLFPVFPKVTVDTEIVVLQKSPPGDWKVHVTIAASLDAFRKTGGDLRSIVHSQSEWQALGGGVINIFLGERERMLAHKCASAGVPLEKLYDINVGIKPYQTGKGVPPQTRHTVATRPFDSNHRVNGMYRRYLRGADINRYTIAPLETRYLKYGPWLAEPRPAARFGSPVKILMRQTGDSLVAAMDTDQFLCLNNMHVLVPKGDGDPDCRFVLAILNSRLLNWYYHTLNPEVGEALAEVKKTNVAKLPVIGRPGRKLHDDIVRLVDHMLKFQKQLAAAKTDHDKISLQRQIETTDHQIDRLVYELYGLTETEIAIVERPSRMAAAAP